MITEACLSEREGISRIVLREYRSGGTLDEGEHWQRSPKGILWSEEGISALNSLMDDDLGTDGAVIRPEKDPEPEVMTVRHLVGNGVMLSCERETGERVLVKVRSTENYGLRTKLLARPPVGDGRLWVRVGREPRWKGEVIAK